MGISPDGVLAIGIDSANYDLIKNWLDYLPNLKKLINKGVAGYSKSTLPPLSPAAWTTIMTGLNPGNTGIFDWIKLSENGKTEIVYSYHIKAPKFWDYLSLNDKKVCIVNMPMTYPALKVNGFMVSGVPGYMSSNRTTYPASLRRELDSLVGGYEIIPPPTRFDLKRRGNEEVYINEFKRVLKKRIRAILYLLDKQVWDLFFPVFFLIDSIQHYFWHHMDPTHPLHNSESKKFKNVIREAYILVDNAIGKLIKESETDPNVIVISDHGMGPLYGYFYVNNFLIRSNVLKINPKGKFFIKNSPLSNFLMSVEVFLGELSPILFKNLLRILPFDFIEKHTARGEMRLNSENIRRFMDPETIAYAIGEYGQIFLTEYAKKAHNREEIIKKLKRLLHNIARYAKNELRVTVYEKKEIYYGKYVDLIPDIYYLINDNQYMPNSKITPDLKVFGPSILTGHHRVHGLFIASGPYFENYKGKDNPIIFDILDFTPTLLALFKLSNLNNLDGKIAIEIFSDEFKQSIKEILAVKKASLKYKTKLRVKKLRKELKCNK